MSKRISILQAAAGIINRQGVHDITISKVAIEAGIGKSTVYEYFTSKEELIQQTVQYIGDVYLDTIKQAVLTNQDGFEKNMKSLIRLIIEAIRKGNNHYLLMMSGCKKPVGPKPDIHGKMKGVMMGFRMKLFEILDAMMTIGEEEGIIKKPDDKMYLLVWQNLMVVLAFEFSGVDAFVELLDIHVKDDDEKNIDIIYGYVVRMLQVGPIIE